MPSRRPATRCTTSRRGSPWGWSWWSSPRGGRARVNGTLLSAGPAGLTLEVEQAYGNCPQYIQQRVLTPAEHSGRAPAQRRPGLTAEDGDLISRADTFFVGSAHPARGADASHRGGPPGFLRVAGDQLWWPDYSGNNMFNTLGNLATDARTALLVPDFGTGSTVQLSGTATVDWTVPGAPGDDDGTGRVVRFTVEQVVSAHQLALHADTRRAVRAQPAVDRRRQGDAMTESPPPAPAVRPRGRAAQGAGRRGRLEQPRPRAGQPRLHAPTRSWRNRDLFLTGRPAIVEFLTAKWQREQDYVLRKSLWTYGGNRIAVRFQYEWHDGGGQWFRSYGNELWQFDEAGLMSRREASINDVTIGAGDRRLLGPRGADEGDAGDDLPLH